MRDLEFQVNGKTYLKMLQISNERGEFQIASSLEKSEFEPKFFKICETNEGIGYEEVDPDTLKELKKIYSSNRKITY